MTSSPLTVSYEQLVSDYQVGLIRSLRGFKPAEHFEFLEAWVPDDDPVQSLFGILEAARDHRLPALAVSIGAAILQSVDLARMRELTERLGQVRIETAPDSGAMLEVVFDDSTAVEGIRPVYAKLLAQAQSSHRHEGRLEEAPDAVLVEATHEGVTLMVRINPSTHVVREAAYQGTMTGVSRGLMEMLCGLLVGRPIQEGSDHAAIRLENALRDSTLQPPVPGIVTPRSADPMFALPERLVRDVEAAYRRQTGAKVARNFYHDPASLGWRALPPEGRTAQVAGAIARHPSGRGVELLSVDGEQRVVVRFAEPLDPSTQRCRLLALEAFLTKTVEPTIQLYLEPRLDANQVRRPRGVTL